MFRSLHMKLVMIMVLLILSVMAVVGAFLINGVVMFYQNEFLARMSELFSNNAEFVGNLTYAASQDDPPYRMRDVLNAYSGNLGIDYVSRNFYILDDKTGAFLTGSDEDSGKLLEVTPNILTALQGEPGTGTSVTRSYMDVAVPIRGEDQTFIVYIRDNKEDVQTLTSEMFMIILTALFFGVFISLVLSLLLSKTMTTPIEDLTSGAKLIASGDFTHRLEIHSHDEIGTLTLTFNNMARILKDTLEAVGNERNKLNTLFLHMTDGVCAFSRDGAIIHMNPAAERMIGVSYRDELVYSNMFGELVPFEKLLTLRQPGFMELAFKKNDKDLTLYFAPFSTDEREGGVIAVIHDDTEQRRLENARREFVANVSHELRTPLTNIKSYAETLADSRDIDEKTSREFLGVITSEADRMTRIVADLLTLSRFDHGRMEWHISSFSFERAVRAVISAMRMETERRRHEIVFSVRGTIPNITADRERIEQVIVNVLSNALKYTPDGGTIEISAGTVPGNVWLAVTDTGIGIPEEDIPRLFERFYRVDKARSREYGGTGLGLSIAKQIVEKHGGRIEVRSTPGKGTTVLFTIALKFSGEET